MLRATSLPTIRQVRSVSLISNPIGDVLIARWVVDVSVVAGPGCPFQTQFADHRIGQVVAVAVIDVVAQHGGYTGAEGVSHVDTLSNRQEDSEWLPAIAHGIRAVQKTE